MNNLRVRAYRVQRINSQFANRTRRKKKEVKVEWRTITGWKRFELREISYHDCFARGEWSPLLFSPLPLLYSYGTSREHDYFCPFNEIR